MKIRKRFAASLSFSLLLTVLPRAPAQEVEIVVAELGGVSVVSIPQPSPLPGLLATKLVLKATPETRLVTFENMQITGAVHQVWFPAFHSDPVATPFVDSAPWNVLPPEWIAVDSYILISPSMVGGAAGNGHRGIDETNDLSDVAMARLNLPNINPWVDIPPKTGVGNIAMAAETDSFSLLQEFQTNEIEFAYVTTPAPSTGAAGDVFLTLGVLGEGIIDSGEPGGASFGFNGNDPVMISFLPEPSGTTLTVFALAAVTCLNRGNAIRSDLTR